jgi:hypothetical protein
VRRRDLPYLLAVAVLAVVFAGDVVSRAVKASGAPNATGFLPGVAGEARDVDVERLERLIRQGHLSDHEALYAKPAGEGD